LEARTVTCPGGVTTDKYTGDREGRLLFSFGAACATCPLQEQCTTAKAGRQLRVHPQEAKLQEARGFQESESGRAVLKERVAAEHGPARLGQLGVGQARYVGRKKTRFQLLMTATVANLRRTWNWERSHEGHLCRMSPGEGDGQARWRSVWVRLGAVVAWRCAAGGAAWVARRTTQAA
jgi:hypothetical protein